MTDDVVTVTIHEAHALGVSALEGIGLKLAESRIVVDHLIDNSLCGYRFAGLPRILAIADSADIKRPRTPITVVHETPVSARIDSGNHVGYVAMHRCTDIAIEKASAHGFALISAHNSWFSGRNAYYLEKIARAGFVGIHVVGATPLVVPPGATKRYLGTNPLAIALPADPDPFMFDMGTAAMMSGEVVLASLLGETSPTASASMPKAAQPTQRLRW